MLAGIVMFAIFAAVNHSSQSGLVLSQDFVGGTTVSIKPANGGVFIQNQNIDQVKVIKDVLVKHNVPLSDISVSDDLKLITVNTKVQLGDITGFKSELGSLSDSTGFFVDKNAIDVANTTTDVAKKLVRDAMYAVGIAMAAIVVYTLIRFK